MTADEVIDRIEEIVTGGPLEADYKGAWYSKLCAIVNVIDDYRERSA